MADLIPKTDLTSSVKRRVRQAHRSLTTGATFQSHSLRDRSSPRQRFSMIEYSDPAHPSDAAVADRSRSFHLPLIPEEEGRHHHHQYRGYHTLPRKNSDIITLYPPPKLSDSQNLASDPELEALRQIPTFHPITKRPSSSSTLSFSSSATAASRHFAQLWQPSYAGLPSATLAPIGPHHWELEVKAPEFDALPNLAALFQRQLLLSVANVQEGQCGLSNQISAVEAEAAKTLTRLNVSLNTLQTNNQRLATIHALQRQAERCHSAINGVVRSLAQLNQRLPDAEQLDFAHFPMLTRFSALKPKPPPVLFALPQFTVPTDPSTMAVCDDAIPRFQMPTKATQHPGRRSRTNSITLTPAPTTRRESIGLNLSHAFAARPPISTVPESHVSAPLPLGVGQAGPTAVESQHRHQARQNHQHSRPITTFVYPSHTRLLPHTPEEMNEATNQSDPRHTVDSVPIGTASGKPPAHSSVTKQAAPTKRTARAPSVSERLRKFMGSPPT
ncbi:hypothetical protein H4R34_004338 [Dimargaris verticillata]|uniref:BLOC-1-related complex subunit 5 n=1 Tax=Dimargaris verticillata TaxID=2761393 RepID=A0A9W8B4D6_9FUNG|nr:hypothetical protein H4R34_004338 [Dimargaris verticillata]